MICKSKINDIVSLDLKLNFYNVIVLGMAIIKIPVFSINSMKLDEPRLSCNWKCSGTNISTSPLAAASEFVIKWLSGKYILVSTCLNRQADFLTSPYIFV